MYREPKLAIKEMVYKQDRDVYSEDPVNIGLIKFNDLGFIQNRNLRNYNYIKFLCLKDFLNKIIE